MRRSSDFSTVVRRGDRVGARTVVLHHRRELHGTDGPALVGLVVSKAVGGSVVRHRVSRRLRAILTQRLDALPAGSATVVRALPSAGLASSKTLAADVDHALARHVRRP